MKSLQEFNHYIVSSGMTRVISMNYPQVAKEELAMSRKDLIHKILSTVSLTFLALFLSFGISLPEASAHGGGLDGDGGHNCRVGSCAGTYHCHQARGPRCGGGGGGGSYQAPSTPKWSIASCVSVTGSSYSRGEVGKIQANLKFWGFNPGPIDGIYGSKTRSALNRFEDKAGIARSTGNVINVTSVLYLWAAC